MRKRIRVLLLATPILAGCGGIVGSGNAHVRAVNAVRGLNSVSVTAGVSIILEDAAYQESSDYESISGGSSTLVELYDTSTGESADATVSLSDGTYNTIYAVGSADDPGLVTVSENHASLDSGYVRVNAVNLSPTQSSVDVYVTSTEEDLDDVSPTFSGLDYEKGKSVVLPTSIYRVRFTKPNSKSVLADYTTEELSDGDMPRFLLLDSSSTTSLQKVVALSDSGD